LLLGDSTKAKQLLGWEATTGLEELARIMTQHDLDLARREAHAKSFVAS
jgi:GDPmannose 4,6-dehydratase